MPATPKLIILTDTGEQTAGMSDGRRLVLAIEDQGVSIGHRRGGYARCTTCQVEVLEGEAVEMTAAEYAVLARRGLHGKVRLSCQLICNRDLRVRPLMTKEGRMPWDVAVWLVPTERELRADHPTRSGTER